MIKRIEKSKAEGKIVAPASKSAAHRALIIASMCNGQKSVIKGITPCEDVLATIDCLRALGAKIEYDGDSATVIGIDFTKAYPKETLNCRESGSTLRFLIPFAMLSGNEVIFVGSERLMERPQVVYDKIAKEYGLKFINDGKSITVKGPLTAGEYFIDGSVSSQFITGLLLALSPLNGDSKIIINRALESRPYLDLTISAMAEFGVRVYNDTDWSFLIFGGQEYKGKEITVEGDWSGAAFMEAFNHIGGKVKIDGLNDESCQGDRVCGRLFDKLDAEFAEINIENCPDLAPILFSLAAIKHGGKFFGTKRLKIKESDRAEVMRQELSKFGAELLIKENSVTVSRRELHFPTERLCGHNDHRIVMSLAVLCSLYGGEIEGCEAVSKSFPDFFEILDALKDGTNEAL
jgi:3-phosphoshikimate 1-carboxyvinyltransferase